MDKKIAKTPMIKLNYYRYIF